MASDATKVLTPEGRVSYPNVFTPKRFSEDDEPKYEITLIFPKSADLSAMKAAAIAAATEKWGADKAKWPKNLRTPFRDGDTDREDAAYAGSIFVRASTKTRPGVVDQNVDDIVDQSEFYPGCYARAVYRAFAYDTKGNKGISFGLDHVQKLRDGEPLGGARKKASEEFEPVESEDPSNYEGGKSMTDDDFDALGI